MVGSLLERTLVRAQIQKVISECDICILQSFCSFVVNRIGHCFRHPEAPIFNFYSLPARSSLDRCRMMGGPGSISASIMFNWRMLDLLGLGAERLVAGRPLVRGQTGYVQRWGDLWFEEIRDSSDFGWNFAKSDKDHVNKLISALLKLFRREREPISVPALEDAPLPLEDG